METFPVVDPLHFEAQVARGKQELQQASIAVLGLARDCSKGLGVSLPFIEWLERNSREHTTIILENDSLDDTAGILGRWQAAGSDRQVMSLTLNITKMESIRCPDRGSKMAWLRNRVHAAFLELHGRKPFTHVVVLDMDLLGGYSEIGILHAMGVEQWDMQGANGVVFQNTPGFARDRPVQYDAWAFRQHSYLPMLGSQVNNMLFKRGTPLLPVLSCFGGLGLYRAPAYAAGTYRGEDCEHVDFHRRLRDNGYGRQFLNPSLMTFYNRRSTWVP